MFYKLIILSFTKYSIYYYFARNARNSWIKYRCDRSIEIYKDGEENETFQVNPQFVNLKTERKGRERHRKREREREREKRERLIYHTSFKILSISILGHIV